MSLSFGEAVDRLINVDANARGTIGKLYESARRLSATPLAMAAAERLRDVVSQDDSVLILTGFGLPPYPQETDGPVGAASLARACDLALKAKPSIIIEKDWVNMQQATCRAAGLTSVGSKLLRKHNLRHVVRVMDFPLDEGKAAQEAERILDEDRPSAVISIEKPGFNRKRQYHSMRGNNITHANAKVDFIVELARKRGNLTIGIGDGGNEIGMGNIRDAVIGSVPYAGKCLCSCKGGIASSTSVDLLVTSTVSNWGAYGIAACLSYLTGELDSIHAPDEESGMIRASVAAGAVDGPTGLAVPAVDGLPESVHTSVITILREMVRRQVKPLFPTMKK